MTSLQSFESPYRAVVFGAHGGIGRAIIELLQADPACEEVASFSRSSDPVLDLTDEASIERAAQSVKQRAPFHLIFDATGVLHDQHMTPEKSLRAVDPAMAARSYAVNALGPLLLLKHFQDLMPRGGRCVFATISARVGSIGDNRLGGWYSYRASKAALNMFMKTAAIELARKRPESVCLALHPGTVKTPLSEPFAGGRATLDPKACAGALLHVIDRTGSDKSGSFLAYDGTDIVW
ncbi:MAG: SDR family NAD(P)-dependent oxidoreductase [Rhizobiales bacterium]|nr:SDR family NAD(P)-dependent oxidoreductase [Hyphomicrobiales bacterium]